MNKRFAQFENRLREFIRVAPAQDDFQSLASELFQLQFEHNQSYRVFCEAEQRTPDRVRQWSDIPAVPTIAFKDFELTCLAPAERQKAFHSSGTTEQRPSRHFHNEKSLSIYQSSLLAWAKRHLPLEDSTLLALTPTPTGAPHSSLVHMFQTFGPCEFLGDVDASGSWMVNTDRLVSAVERAKHPVGLLGTAFNFVHLIDALAERDLQLKLPQDSWVLETGGYKGRSRSIPKDQLHRLISERLGVSMQRIVCEYGMSELSSQAYATSLMNPIGGPRVFRFPPWARVQVVSPEHGREVGEGETGLLRVFDLANVYSVVAIETQDLAVRRGDGFELAGRAQAAEARGCSLMAS